MDVSNEIEYSLEDVLDHEELQKFETPQKIEQQPDAQVVHWDDMLAVTTPGSSIASSMDRFKAGDMNLSHFRTVQGFASEFTENNEQLVFVNADLKELLGDQAMAVTQETDQTYAVAVRTPEEALDTVRKYDRNYAGDVEGDFWDEITSRHAVMPVLYNSDDELVSDTGVALMGGRGVMTGDDSITAEQLLEEDEVPREARAESMDTTEAELDSYPAPDSVEAERYVDVMLPPGYKQIGHQENDTTLVIEIDGEKQMLETISQDQSVLDYHERNGVYSIELG